MRAVTIVDLEDHLVCGPVIEAYLPLIELILNARAFYLFKATVDAPGFVAKAIAGLDKPAMLAICIRSFDGVAIKAPLAP